jgi:hypothetical protein
MNLYDSIKNGLLPLVKHNKDYNSLPDQIYLGNSKNDDDRYELQKILAMVLYSPLEWSAYR